jgi:hypothetical protein
VDDRDQLGHVEAEGFAELEESLPFDLGEKDSLLGNPFPNYLVFRFDKLELPTGFVLRRTCQR